MEDLVDQIAQLDPLLIDQAINALVRRCSELYPEHELTVFFLRKENPNEQIDHTIRWLQTLKECTSHPLPPIHFPVEEKGISSAYDLLTKSRQSSPKLSLLSHRRNK